MTYDNVKRVGVIGAGVAGLQTAKTLLAEGYEVTVFERGERIGGVWAAGYSGFGVQVQKELYELPDFPMSDDAPDFAPGPMVQQHLERYVDHFGLRPLIRLETSIRGVTPRADGAPGWTVAYERRGRIDRDDFDLVVVATGLFSDKPAMPELPGRDAFGGDVRHGSQVRSRAPLANRRVAVVGYGKTAADLALEAAEVAGDVHLVFRDVHWPVPRKLLGLIPWKWGLLTRMAGVLIPPYQRPSPLARALHTLGKPLVWLFWRLVEVLLYFQWGLGAKIANGKNLVPTTPVEIDAFGESTMLPRPELYDAIRSGRIIAHRTEIERFTEDGVVLADGDSLALDTVVFATGWRASYGFLDDTLREPLGEDDVGDGFYLYRHMLHPSLPNLVFIGRNSSIQSPLSYALQARWLAALLDGRVALPGDDEMLAAIEQQQQWKRSWMPHSSSRGARLLLHAMHYHDELLRDFGERPFRKRGVLAPLKELFAPYQASDYRDVVARGRSAPVP